jgi:ELWxxDGT repeat protein
VGDTVFFGANDPPYGNQLWKSDGTAEGTVFVTDTPNGPESPVGFTAFNEMAYFFALGGAHYLWLWRTDGTPAGTVPVQWVSQGLSTPPLVKISARLFFTANGVLWRSDGAPAGTVMMIEPDCLADELADVGGRMLIACDTYQPGQYELWKSDGTDPGTVLVRRFVGATYKYGIWEPKLTAVGGQLFFASDDGVHGDELWKSDGTREGTTLVADINPGLPASRPTQLLALDGQLFFYADDGTHGSELWRSDGTAQGTTMVRDISPGATASSLGRSGWGVAGNAALFAADDGIAGNELWVLAPRAVPR